MICLPACMKLSPLEQELAGRYKRLPKLGIHGMRLDYFRSNNGNGITSPKGTIYFHVISEFEKELMPEEFVQVFKRSIYSSCGYAMSDLSEQERCLFKNGLLNDEKLPVIIYLLEPDKDYFVLTAEKMGSHYNLPYPEIEPGRELIEGAFYGRIPESAVAGKVFLAKEEAEQMMAETRKQNLNAMPDKLKWFNASRLLFNAVYMKAIEGLRKFSSI